MGIYDGTEPIRFDEERITARIETGANGYAKYIFDSSVTLENGDSVRLLEESPGNKTAIFSIRRSAPQPTDDQLLAAMLDLWQKMTESKPNDRSEKDRRYAVAITKLQDTIAWFKAMVIDEFKPLI
jgi:ABC-type phosphate/phosphonate transport system substrate-binding protein